MFPATMSGLWCWEGAAPGLTLLGESFAVRLASCSYRLRTSCVRGVVEAQLHESLKSGPDAALKKGEGAAVLQ